jgi:hypothetical protein
MERLRSAATAAGRKTGFVFSFIHFALVGGDPGHTVFIMPH